VRGARAYSQAMNCHGRQLGQSTGAFVASPGQLCCFLGQGHKNNVCTSYQQNLWGAQLGILLVILRRHTGVQSCTVLVCLCIVITTTRPAPVTAYAGHMIQGTCSVQASHPSAGRPEWLQALGNAPAVHGHGRLQEVLNSAVHQYLLHVAAAGHGRHGRHTRHRRCGGHRLRRGPPDERLSGGHCRDGTLPVLQAR